VSAGISVDCTAADAVDAAELVEPVEAAGVAGVAGDDALDVDGWVLCECE